MTDKERLEEIEEAYRLSHKHIGAYVSSEGIEWLIEYAKKQAERVQELEEENVILKATRAGNEEHIEVLHKQNKRYREALVRLRNDINKQETGYEKNVFVIKTVDDALIDWEG